MNRRWRRRWVLLAVLLQIGAVAAIALHKEWVLHNGRSLWVQTAPIDPRDIFRGDYVSLNYLFTRLRSEQIDPALQQRGLRKGEAVYLAMRIDASGLASALRLQLQRPDFPYLRGWASAEWPYWGYHLRSRRNRDGFKPGDWPLRVRYGIEQYYVEQGRGLELEKIRGSRDDFQRSMLVELAVPDSGQALIRGYRWSDLAIRTKVLQQPEPEAPDDRASIQLRLSLRNEGKQPIELDLRPDGCSFELRPTAFAPADAERILVGREAFCSGRAPVRHRLTPGARLDIVFDFNQPQWRARVDGELKPLGRLPWNYQWRLVYRDPPPAGLHGRILSRAFHARGNLD